MGEGGEVKWLLALALLGASAPATYDEAAAWTVWEEAARLTGLSARSRQD